MTDIDPIKLLALRRLLAMPDPSELKGRGQKPVQAGTADRWERLGYVQKVNMWVAHRMEQCHGPLDGWKLPEKILLWRKRSG